MDITQVDEFDFILKQICVYKLLIMSQFIHNFVIQKNILCTNLQNQAVEYTIRLSNITRSTLFRYFVVRFAVPIDVKKSDHVSKKL